VAAAWRWRIGRSQSQKANEGAIAWRQRCRRRRVEGNDLEEVAGWRKGRRLGGNVIEEAKVFFMLFFFFFF
jgi:hypothetical protein